MVATKPTKIASISAPVSQNTMRSGIVASAMSRDAKPQYIRRRMNIANTLQLFRYRYTDIEKKAGRDATPGYGYSRSLLCFFDPHATRIAGCGRRDGGMSCGLARLDTDTFSATTPEPAALVQRAPDPSGNHRGIFPKRKGEMPSLRLSRPLADVASDHTRTV